MPRLVVTLLDNYEKEIKKYKAKLIVYYLKDFEEGWNKIQGKKLEESTEHFEIKEDKLY